MLTIEIGRVINSLTDQLLYDKKTPPQWDESNHTWTAKGLRFRVETEISSYENGEEFSTNGDVVVVLANYGVWIGTKKGLLDTYKNVSNHDSCWRDGVERAFTEFYFSLCEEVNRQRFKAGLEVIPSAEMNVFTTFGFHGVYENVRVDYKKDPNDSNNYLRILVGVENSLSLGCV